MLLGKVPTSAKKPTGCHGTTGRWVRARLQRGAYGNAADGPSHQRRTPRWPCSGVQWRKAWGGLCWAPSFAKWNPRYGFEGRTMRQPIAKVSILVIVGLGGLLALRWIIGRHVFIPGASSIVPARLIDAGAEIRLQTVRDPRAPRVTALPVDLTPGTVQFQTLLTLLHRRCDSYEIQSGNEWHYERGCPYIEVRQSGRELLRVFMGDYCFVPVGYAKFETYRWGESTGNREQSVYYQLWILFDDKWFEERD